MAGLPRVPHPPPYLRRPEVSVQPATNTKTFLFLALHVSSFIPQVLACSFFSIPRLPILPLLLLVSISLRLFSSYFRLLNVTSHFRDTRHVRVSVCRNQIKLFSVSNFRRVLNVACCLLGNFPASEFHMPTFRDNLFHLHRQVGMMSYFIPTCL